MLEIRNLGVRYGRHIALDGVSATVEKGEICVILGANGAGKSSLLKAVAGMVPVAPGTEIVMNGRTITGMKPHRIVEEGIALVPEGRGIFGDLTVAENLQLGAFAQRARAQEAETLAQIYTLFPRLAERKKQIARTMSGGEQQMVAIGRALMSRPDILMLDEPSLGLSPLLSKELFKSLAAVAATGVGILLVEQNARLSLKIARRGYLIENGLITGEDTAIALMNDPAVVNAYLGGRASPAARGVKKSDIRLPAPFALPAALDAMSRLMGKLAERAGRIHAAFIRALRRDAVVPSAFEGRYDPMLERDPWDAVEMPAPAPQPSAPRKPRAADDARAVAETAGVLAERAATRLSEHLTARRKALPASKQDAAEAVTPTPLPFVNVAPAAARAPVELDIAALVAGADRRLKEHLAARRPAALPAALVTPNAATPAPRAEPVRDDNDIASMIASADRRLREHLQSQRTPRPATTEPPQPAAPLSAPPPPVAAERMDYEALAANAGARMRTHVSSFRREKPSPAVKPEQAMAIPPARHEAPAEPGSIDELARHAGERLRRHLSANRDATLTARVRLFEEERREREETAAPAEPEAPKVEDDTPPMLGHNSQGVLIEEEEPIASEAGDDGLDLTRLASRAAEIQAAYTARQRKRLTVFNFSPEGWSTGDDPRKTNQESALKRKEHKEA